MEWLGAQAQQASPFIATFCLLALSVVGGIARMIWKQLLFERSEHRTAERSTSEAMTAVAKSLERLATMIDRPRRRRSS